MICTYCQQSGHTARTCPRRPGCVSTPTPLLVATLSIALSACAQEVTIAPSRLMPPTAELMVAPPEPEDIPACEAQRECRVRYYAKSRADRAMLADRLRGLQRWVRTAKGGT